MPRVQVYFHPFVVFEIVRTKKQENFTNEFLSVKQLRIDVKLEFVAFRERYF